MDTLLFTLPRLVIGAPQGRSGKTTATLALVGALAARGLIVQPFKKGPDYIDPSWLTATAGRSARNLDSFMLSKDAVLRSVALGSQGADIAVVEGNHGLYDSYKSYDEEGMESTAALARLLKAPILFVVDATRMGRSAAALVEGYQCFEPDTNLAGVILNNVSRPRHAEKLKAAIERHCGIPVVGMLPRDEALSIPDRHLGLIPQTEYARQAIGPLDALRSTAEEMFDLDGILEIARMSPPIPVPNSPAPDASHGEKAKGARIGVVRDAAFTFYYPENLEALQDAGAELVFVDALHETTLPKVKALYIGGGFPEVFAEQLESNASLRAEIRAAIENDLPVYAECGGLMYLARSIRWDGKRAKMVGALPCDIEVVDTPQGHGYVEAQVVCGNPFFPVGACLRGHEYHHSRVVNLEGPLAYRLTRGRGIQGGDGIVYRNVLAAYTHLHALGTPQWSSSFLRCAGGEE